MLGALPPRSQVQRAEKSHKTSSGLCSLPPPSAPPQSAQASGTRRHRHPTTDSAIVSLKEVNVSESASKTWTREAKRLCGLLGKKFLPTKKDGHC